MFYYWYRIIRILISRNFQEHIDIENELTRTFRVRLFDCDGLRVMAAFKYSIYMDFMRWELMARSKLYNEMARKGLGPALGAQKIVYRKPLKVGTKFNVRLTTAGWDEKWVYNIHKFEQGGEIKAIGITKALIWRKDSPQLFIELLKNIGVKNLNKRPPAWVLSIFQNDKEMIANNA